MEKESVAIFTCMYLLHVEEEWDVHVPWHTTEVRDGRSLCSPSTKDAGSQTWAWQQVPTEPFHQPCPLFLSFLFILTSKYMWGVFPFPIVPPELLLHVQRCTLITLA